MMRSLYWMLLAAWVMLSPSRVYAYTQEIQAPVEEVWIAVKEAAASPGLDKVDEKDKVLETEWTEDRVVRMEQLMPFMKKAEHPKTWERRYRLRVELIPVPEGTRVAVRGKFQLKDPDLGVRGKWDNVKPESEDYDMERQFFFRALDILGQKRVEAPAS